jgi:hypothetical protein
MPMVSTTSRRVVVLPINMDHLRMWHTPKGITPAWSCWSTEYWMGVDADSQDSNRRTRREFSVGNDKLIINKINR